MKHRIETSQIDTPWGLLWFAWSDNLGADSSPIGTDPDRETAIADVEHLLAEMEEDA